MEVVFGKQKLFDSVACSLRMDDLLVMISKKMGLDINEFFLISNGRLITQESIISNKVYVSLKIPGGKGGFGSMLRAIGAQIEKTTNREACRDLSGRRLRDINEEQRLKKWVAEQADREKETKERKKKKLEKLLEQPKHTFIDQEYDKERSSLPEKVEDAVLQGLEASCSTKRKSDDTKSKVVKKRRKLWMDSELDEDISSSESENGDEDSKSPIEARSSGSPENSASKDDSGKNTEATDSNGTTQTDSELSTKSELSESIK